MKLTYYGIQICKSMYPRKNGINSINIFNTDSHKSFSICYGLLLFTAYILKRILTYLYCTNYNEINKCHSYTQKHVSNTGSYKKFLIYEGVCLELYFQLCFMVCIYYTKF